MKKEIIGTIKSSNREGITIIGIDGKEYFTENIWAAKKILNVDDTFDEVLRLFEIEVNNE